MEARASKDTWAKRVQRWTESGLSAGEFGAEIGVNPRTLTYWKWLLKKEGKAHPTPRPRAARRATSSVALSFVEMTAPVTAEPLEVLVGGLRVRVPIAFDDATLVRLVSVLERRG